MWNKGLNSFIYSYLSLLHYSDARIVMYFWSVTRGILLRQFFKMRRYIVYAYTRYGICLRCNLCIKILAKFSPPARRTGQRKVVYGNSRNRVRQRFERENRKSQGVSLTLTPDRRSFTSWRSVRPKTNSGTILTRRRRFSSGSKI